MYETIKSDCLGSYLKDEHSGPYACNNSFSSPPVGISRLFLMSRWARSYFLPSSELFRRAPSWASAVIDCVFLTVQENGHTITYLYYDVFVYLVDSEMKRKNVFKVKQLQGKNYLNTTVVEPYSLSKNLPCVHSFIHQNFQLNVQENQSSWQPMAVKVIQSSRTTLIWLAEAWP